MWWPAVWGLLLVVGLAVEGMALRRPGKGDTLSEQVWLLRTRRWGRLLLMPAWLWLTWHFFVEPAGWSPAADVWIDDVVVVVVALLIGGAVSYAEV